MSLERARFPREREVTPSPPPEVSRGPWLCYPSNCQQRASWDLVCWHLPACGAGLPRPPTSTQVPQTPFLLLHPSHDSVFRNVPGAKGKAGSREMNAYVFPFLPSFPKKQGHLCLSPLPTLGP